MHAHKLKYLLKVLQQLFRRSAGRNTFGVSIKNLIPAFGLLNVGARRQVFGQIINTKIHECEHRLLDFSMNGHIKVLVTPNCFDYKLRILEVVDLKKRSHQPQLEVETESLIPQGMELLHFVVPAELLLDLVVLVDHVDIERLILLIENLLILAVVILNVVLLRYLVLHKLTIGVDELFLLQKIRPNILWRHHIVFYQNCHKYEQ